jgi:NAD(P)-dependent dehydrogenase (short-subunit alcohol dehydrogenase family)
MGRLDGKVALITGAGSGIGRASAVLFAAEGARVSVVDRVPEGGQETVKMIRDAGGKAIFVEADVSKAASAEDMVRTTSDQYGRLDILFNHAGIQGAIGLPTADISEADFDLVINVNLKGIFFGCKYALPMMLKHGGGVIINTASILGQAAMAGGTPYCISKAGIIQLTKQVASEYSRFNIRANCICPGLVRTPLIEPYFEVFRLDTIPIGRAATAEDIARVALFLASDDSAYITGAAIVADGGCSAEARLLLKE